MLDAAGELRRGISALLVVGGDGMVHLAVNALAGTQVPLGIVPTGTGNDFARLFNLPAEPRTAVGHFLQSLEQPHRVDLGRVTRADGTKCWFAGVLSAGFDAAVNDRANRWRFPRGRLRYPLAMLRELGTTAEVSKGTIFSQAQLARAVALGLGAPSAEAVVLRPASDSASEAIAATLQRRLLA